MSVLILTGGRTRQLMKLYSGCNFNWLLYNFLPHFVNAKHNLIFFKDVLFHLLEDVPLETRAFLRFFHDDAPCHNAHIARNWVNNNNFPSRLHILTLEIFRND
jgi:hypothetical protein